MASLVERLRDKVTTCDGWQAYESLRNPDGPEAAGRITTLEAELAAMKARGDRLAEAFLETREMLGLAEQAVCEECCPTTWKTADGRPHCKLHEDIRAVLFKHEATRDQALTEWRDQ